MYKFTFGLLQVITGTTSTGQFKSASWSASWMNTNKIVKEGNQLAFNRVVGGAPQRAHIRLKPRHHHHHHRTKDETKADDISSSDSSSYNRSSPPAIPDLSKLGTQTAEIVLESVESEGSSESCTFFRPTHTVLHHKHNSKKRHDTTSPSDAGIVSSCSITTASQSCLSMSRGSSSGQDASDSGMVSRNSGQRKRSVAGHYQAIKRTSSQCVGDDDDSPITTHLNTIPIHTSDKDMAGERKRRRFNRTFGALRQCGLLDLTLQTAALMETSQQMQKQIESLRNETKTLHDTMFTFADVQPNFLATSGAQQVMNQLEEFANTPIMDNRSFLGLDSVLPSISSGCPSDSMSQVLQGALNMQWHQQNSPAGAQTHHLLQGGHHHLAQNAGYPSIHTEAKKQKYSHNSVCSSQTMTSTETGSPTDSDELQKV